MILDIQFCENVRILKIFYLLKSIITIIQIAVPIILIVMCSIDLIKNIINIKDNQNIVSKIVKRMLSAVIIFFVPTIINFTLNLVGNVNEQVGICMNNSTKENIDILQKIENERRIALLEAEKIRRQQYEEQQKKEKEAAAEAKRIRKEQKKQNNVLMGDEDCVDPNTDGRVYVKNGTFYIPGNRESGTDGTQGSAPQGMNSCFYQSLGKLIEDAKSNGYTVTVTSGWRSYSAQVATFNKYGRNPWRAANPGGSRHGWGIAADLGYSPYNAALNWVHTNSKKYGLWFRLSHENWHIEPMALTTY
ncbi:MAG: M15 family metallopeptidase [Bacilli bacterium]|nr:M15 family metallopeptidase [Bacilli bacterium]